MQTATDQRSLAMRRVDRLAEQAELVVDRGAVGLNRRRDVLREQLELEPPVAAHDAEAAPLAGRSCDGCVPVDLDAHRTWSDREGPVARDERHGHRGERAERCSRSFWAAFGLIPPTSMPAILVPSASRSAEPAKKSGTPTASRPAARPRIAILVQKRERTTERPRTAEDEAATARAMVAADAD